MRSVGIRGRLGAAVLVAGLTGLVGAAGPARAAAEPARAAPPAFASVAALLRAQAEGAQVPGMDVSGHQGNVDWPAAYRDGARFAYVKATEGTGFRNPYFAQQYNGSYEVGMIRGAYHFALPDRSGATAQADYFVDHGGGWSADGKTLPPMLDIEYNPYGSQCYGLSPVAMTDWIKEFSDRIHARTTQLPMIYTTTDWWRTCTGELADFSQTNPLFIARYAQNAGPLPENWTYYTLWQYSDSGKFPGDQNVFNGTMERLRALAGEQPPAKSEPPPATSEPPATPTSTTVPTTTASADPPPAATTTTTPATATPPVTSPSTPEQPEPAVPGPAGGTPGLVWTNATAGGNEPPTSLGSASAGKRNVVAQPRPTATPMATSSTSPTFAPMSVTPTPRATESSTAAAAASTSAAKPDPRGADLAETGTHTLRLVVFGASLVVLGGCLIVLLRITASRFRRSR